jgi:HEAT repeat protein
MRNIQKSQSTATGALRGVLTALLLAGAFGSSQSVARADAVDDLKQALQAREKDLANLANLEKLVVSPEKFAANLPSVLAFWRETLTKKVDNLQTIGDLWGALGLKDWKDLDILSGQALRAMDSDLRRLVGTRLKDAIQDIIEKGDANLRLSVVHGISERGPTYRSLTVVKGNQTVEEEPAGFMRGLVPQIIKLTADKDLGVRQEALRALGNIFPRPQDAVPVFQKALMTEAVGPKRVAAGGLGQLVRVVGYLGKPGRPATEVKADPGDVLVTAAAVLGGNGAGLMDSDAQVRVQCLQNIQEAAQALADLIFGSTRRDFPPVKRKLLPEEMKDILDKTAMLEADLKTYLPVLEALRKEVPALTRSLKDPEAGVRLAAVDALENIGNARLRLKNRISLVPLVEGDKASERTRADLLTANDPLEKFINNNLAALAMLLADPDVVIRRKTVEFLEIVEEAAAPAVPLLSKSLSDTDRYVRWAAARAIYNIAPEKAAEAVQGLAKLLSDHDLNVRIAAAKTLKEMGPAAQAAVPALTLAIVNGDAEGRVWAMEALQSIGPAAGKKALPQLIAALANIDPRVRRGAAKTLGSFGPAAFPALDALRERLADDDQNVRVNASDAMTAVLQNTKW